MKKMIYAGLLFVICALFVYFRVPSLLAHYVAYTYDQGRDFIAGANIVRLHKIPFIGPTTGINGLFHGSWWYYLLAIPYLLFNGATIGYYWFNFSIQFALLIVLMLYLKKEFGLLVSILFGLFVTVAPYFTFMSLFVGNNSMVLPSLLFFLIFNYYVFKDKTPSVPLLFGLGVSLALIGEFELSFGIFLVPLYFLALLVFRSLRSAIFHRNGVFFALGLAAGFAPRILFELKNGFMQTKVLFGFLLHPKLYNNPAPYLNRVSERWILFRGYYFEMFTNRYFGIIFLVSMLMLLGLTIFSIIKHKTKLQPFFLFCIYLLSGLFFLATLYKDFFWKNYYEGIHYVFVFACIALISHNVHKKFIILKRALLMSLLIGLVGLTVIHINESYKTTPPFDGLQVQEAVINHIIRNQDQNQEYCLRIYVPAVIPHTYDYLLLANNMRPTSEWVNGTCWFIVEADSYQKRRDDWLSVHEPKEAHTLEKTLIKDVEVRHYRIRPNK